MAFKKMRGCRKPEKVQGLIYYTCINYSTQPAHIRKKIDRLCASQGNIGKALREWITTGASATYISQKWYWSESALYAARRRFFDEW